MNLTPDQVDDLQTLIDYNWADEQRDWEEHGAEDQGERHIFHVLRRLQNAVHESLREV